MKLQRPLSSLKAAAARRKKGYFEACLNIGKLDDRTGVVHFTEAGWSLLRAQYRLDIPSTQSKMPGIIAQGRNLATTAGKTIIAAAKGEPILVSDAQKEERLSICATCDKLVNKEQPREAWKCAMCGCNLDGKLFAADTLRTKDCPAGKWPKLTPPAP